MRQDIPSETKTWHINIAIRDGPDHRAGYTLTNQQNSAMDAIKTMEVAEEINKMDYDSPAEEQEKPRVAEPPKGDVFGDEDAGGVQYKVLSWQYDPSLIRIDITKLTTPQKMRNRSVIAQRSVESANQPSDARPDDLTGGVVAALRHRDSGSNTVSRQTHRFDQSNSTGARSPWSCWVS